MKIKAKDVNSGYEGYAKVPRFSKKTRAKIIIAASLVFVFVSVYVLSLFGVIPLSALKARVMSNITQDKENFPISINTDSTLRTDNLGDSIIILTTNNVFVYSQRGVLTYSQTHTFASPALSVNGDKAVVFDRGEKGFLLLNEKKVVHSGNSEYDIICAEYGEDGNYALGTQGKSSTSMLSVYSDSHKLIFNWTCDYEHIANISLSDDGNFAGVAVVGADNGELFTTVNYFGFEYKEPFNTHTVNGAVVLDLEYTAFNTLMMFTDNGVYRVEKGAENPQKVADYYSTEFVSCDVNSNGVSAVALAKYGSTNDININIYKSNGKEKVNISLNIPVESVSITDKYVFALAEKVIMVYNLSGKQVSEIKIQGDAYSILPNDDFIYIVSLDKISRCFSYGDSVLELII